jgi:hypothetical protein
VERENKGEGMERGREEDVRKGEKGRGKEYKGGVR